MLRSLHTPEPASVQIRSFNSRYKRHLYPPPARCRTCRRVYAEETRSFGSEPGGRRCPATRPP
jgi:hypothetical protein